MNIAIFTRTSWSEYPRLRHQVARLLAEHKHEITFFELPDNGHGNKITFLELPNHRSAKPRKVSERITVVPMPEIIHHQLRPFRFISDVANYYAKKSISYWFENHSRPDIIINFNYYFYFLKDLFPDIPLCTIINDDFEAQAKPWMKKSIASQVHDTCRSSDAVLTVSYPLLDKLRSMNKQTHLFFPWAAKNYSPPQQSARRNVALYYGHINHRMYFKLLDTLASSGVVLRLIGPVQRTVDSDALNRLLRHTNVSLLPPSPIDQVDFTDVCCSIMAYNLDVKSVNSGSLGNRSFNLLSYGIPLLVSAIPNGIELAPDAISYCSTAEQFLLRIKYLQHNFMNVQESIRQSLRGHYAEDRYRMLCRIFEIISGKSVIAEPTIEGSKENELLSESIY